MKWSLKDQPKAWKNLNPEVLQPALDAANEEFEKHGDEDKSLHAGIAAANEFAVAKGISVLKAKV